MKGMRSVAVLLLLVAACADVGGECKAGAGTSAACEGQDPQGVAGSLLLQTSRAVEQTTWQEDGIEGKSSLASTGVWTAMEVAFGPRWTSLAAGALRPDDPDFAYIMCLEFLVCSVSVSAYLLWRHVRGSKPGFRSGPRTMMGRRQVGEAEEESPRKLPESAVVAEGVGEGEDGREAVVEKADADAALRAAVWAGSAPLVAELLRCGASAAAVEGPRRETPLHCGARAGSAEVCELLLEAGAELDPVDSRGFTPLVAAADVGWEGVCEMLLDRGAGAGGLTDEELPPLLTNMLVRRIIAGMEPQAAQGH